MNRNVCIFFPAIGRGGLERALIEISRSLAENGNRIRLFYLKSRGETLDLLDSRVEKHQVRLPFKDFLFDRRFLAGLVLGLGWLRFLLRARPDCVIGFQSSSVAVGWTRILGIPFIHRESSDCRTALARQNGRLKPALVRLGKRMTYRYCDAIIANSAGSAESLSRVTGLARESIRIIYNPLNIEGIRSLSREPIEEGMWFGNGAKVIMAMGRLSPEKNHLDLIRAFRRVADASGAKLVIAGEGSERPNLEREIDSLALRRDVKLIGHLGNPYPYLGRAALFVLTSIYEGLPNCLLEAIALDVPLVSYDCPSGPKEILLEGKGGRLVRPGDIPALSEAILASLNDAAATKAMVKAAAASLQRFNPEAAGSHYAKAVEEVMAKCARAGEPAVA